MKHDRRCRRLRPGPLFPGPGGIPGGNHFAAAAAGKNTAGVITSKAAIEEGDFWENVAFVGKTLTGEDIIAVLPNALITSGFELEGKAKEGSVVACTFTCHAEMEGELDTLPWEIIYPEA